MYDAVPSWITTIFGHLMYAMVFLEVSAFAYLLGNYMPTVPWNELPWYEQQRRTNSFPDKDPNDNED